MGVPTLEIDPRVTLRHASTMSGYVVIDLTREDEDDEHKLKNDALRFLHKVKHRLPRDKYDRFLAGIKRLGRCLDEGTSVVDDVEKVMDIVASSFDETMLKEFRVWCPWFPETDVEIERSLLRDIQGFVDERSELLRSGTYMELSEKLMQLYKRK